MLAKKVVAQVKTGTYKVVMNFVMESSKPITTSLVVRFRHTADMAPSVDEEREYISEVVYASLVGS